jgi:ribosome maturation factor RimP
VHDLGCVIVRVAITGSIKSKIIQVMIKKNDGRFFVEFISTRSELLAVCLGLPGITR